MTIAALNSIPSKRRDMVFDEIRQLVSEVEAADRSLERLDEGWAIDDALEQIIVRLNGEIRRARNSRSKQEVA